uniref:Uncharacterized protein n=1 Tax=Diaporthe longicolla TaxID=54899 RepID=A0A7H0XJZ3_9PEZI|nr:hypothetical protein [Diaporthe longicolla]
MWLWRLSKPPRLTSMPRIAFASDVTSNAIRNHLLNNKQILLWIYFLTRLPYGEAVMLRRPRSTTFRSIALAYHAKIGAKKRWAVQVLDNNRIPFWTWFPVIQSQVLNHPSFCLLLYLQPIFPTIILRIVKVLFTMMFAPTAKTMPGWLFLSLLCLYNPNQRFGLHLPFLQ